MSTMREAWTDERMDDLTVRVDRGFERVDADFRELRAEMHARFNAVDARFDAMQRTMILGFAGIVASVIATQL
ncbi:MAG: hypothetical protein H0X42_02170 [Solirubrobacterales bacterium]|nr:hypothetical protein [Solirubrobacterales bacterium]